MNEQNLKPALDLITRPDMEGLKLHSYQDPVGIWTIGFGTTIIDGHPVVPGIICTESQAYQWCMNDCVKIRDQISTWITRPLNNNQFCALVSFCYNVGLQAFYKSTMLRLINDDAKPDEIAVQFKRWVHGGGRVLPGLVRRRELEAELFLEAV